MGYVRSQKFCCCIPVRFGVFIMPLLGMVAGAFFSFCYWAACLQIKKHQISVTKNERIVIFISTALYTGFTIVSLFGFIGCLLRRRILVQIYAGVSWSVLIVSIITGSIFLWGLYHRDPSAAISDCLESAQGDGITGNIAESLCKNGTKFLKGAERIGITIGFVIGWLIQLYGCHIISSYVSQLEEEEDAYGRRGGVSTTQVNVMPVVATPLPNSYGQPYPFTQHPNVYSK